MTELRANWNYPNSISTGAGRIAELAEKCNSLEMMAPLIITDPGLAELTMVINAQQICTKAGLSCGLFSNIQANPTSKNVIDGVLAYKEGKHDGVIAFGGGSAIDAAKAVALMVGQNRPLWDFEDIGDNWARVNEKAVAPIIAIPTTAGTGSEVGRASVIMDVESKVKKIIFHPKMLPQLVILDPELTIGLPENITAATGMDALSHCLEALCAPFFHPMADGIAVEGIRLVKEYLPRAVNDGQDIDARTQMLVASSMGATAFQKGLGAMHALSHTLGALYGSHHGLLNAILMPYVLKANQDVIETKIERLAHYIGLEDASFDGFMYWVFEMRRNLNIPHALSSLDIDDSQAELIGVMSAKDPCAGGNPILFTAEMYSALFVTAVNGC
jgi:alcohol dehydrogenase class IV